MELFLDGKSEIRGEAKINLCYLIFSRHLIIRRAVANRFFSVKRPILLDERAKYFELPSNISAMPIVLIAATHRFTPL